MRARYCNPRILQVDTENVQLPSTKIGRDHSNGQNTKLISFWIVVHTVSIYGIFSMRLISMWKYTD